MCGIAGMCSFIKDYIKNDTIKNQNLEILIKMRESLFHRGHDQFGEFIDKHIGLSHTRLSIRDISNGRQPMTKTRNLNNFTICFNGEIYNTKEINNTLSEKGYVFTTSCDTETILFSYMEYGVHCVDYLNGIFAFAIWDSKKQQLFLARDHAGVKPLFYTIKNKELFFASEIKGIFSNPKIKPIVDINSFREILGVGPARTPGNGVFKDICELKPGQMGIFNKSGLHLHTYWDIPAFSHNESYSDTVEHVSFLLKDSIERQMISDVPVCSFLSGGIDSSIVTSVASKIMFDKQGVFNTFSFDFTGNDKYFQSNSFQPERDNKYVYKMLDYLKEKKATINHTNLLCNEEELADYLDLSMNAKDLPGMADVDASLLYFCSLVSKKNKVALTGECADEIFGGYPWFYRKNLLLGEGFPWSKHIDVRESLLNDSFIKKLDLSDYSNERYLDTIKEVPSLSSDTLEEKRRREITYLNIKWFMQTLLDRMDRASMYSGLEARVPFADYRIIEYVFNVPWNMKYQNGVEKTLLRDAFHQYLPKDILNRKKSPYPKTYNPHYESILKKRLLDMVLNPLSPVNSIIDKEKFLEFIKIPASLGKPWFGQLMASPQLMAYFIQINDWLVEYNPVIDL